MFSGWGVDSLLAIMLNQRVVTKVQQDLKPGQGSTYHTEDHSNNRVAYDDFKIPIKAQAGSERLTHSVSANAEALVAKLRI